MPIKNLGCQTHFLSLILNHLTMMTGRCFIRRIDFVDQASYFMPHLLALIASSPVWLEPLMGSDHVFAIGRRLH